MKGGRSLWFLLPLVALASSYPTSTYHGHQLWRVEGEGVLSVIEGVVGVDDVWSHGRDRAVIQVPPAHTRSLSAHLSSQGVSYTVVMEDIQSAVDREREDLLTRKADVRSSTKKGRIDTGTYNQLEEIEAYLQELAASVPWVSVSSIAQTSEGRDMWVATLAAPGGSSPKPSVWLDCGIHAREWISPATCVYGLDLLTTQYGTDPDVTAFLDKYDLYVLPVHNPDGYYFTWHNDRLWRKNRMQHPGDTCHGIDLNRNYDDGHWGGAGASENSCSDLYQGPSGFSELETQAVRDYTNQLQANNLTAFFSLHSFGQMWMYAYGWTSEDTPHEQELYRVSEVGVTALRAVHDTVYTYGSIYDTIYPSSGVSPDWSYSRGVVYSFILELRDEGENGFLLPADQIIATAEETWAGLLAGIMAI